MNELYKLELYLKSHNITYVRRRRAYDTPEIDEHFKLLGEDYGEQIIVYDTDGERSWDAIWGYGSYGYYQDLLEIMGNIVYQNIDHDSVAGWLTADDVIRRLEDTE